MRGFGLRRCLSAGAVALSLILAACGSSATPTLPPVAVTVYRTGTPLPTSAQALATPSASVATALPASATPALLATTIPVYGPDSYPDHVNPFTGQVVDPQQVARRPVAVKISNFPYSVRPQSGLALADLVFEHSAEAGLTRFTAIFLQNDAAKVGSIRSARYIDTELAPMFGALLVTSGSSLGTMAHLRENPWFWGANVWRLISEETSYRCPPLCRETPDDANTLFANTEALRAATNAQGGNQKPSEPISGFTFSDQTPPGGTAVTTVQVDMSSAAHVEWRYDAGLGRYTRWQEKDLSGELAPHTDAVTDQIISAANVVILQASHVNNFVPEDFRDGGNCGQEIQLWTAGPANIFREGQWFEGRWHRDASTNWKLRLETGDGTQAIHLKPGNTWFEVVGLTANTAQSGAIYKATHKVLDTKSECPVPPTETPTVTPEGWFPTETPTPAP
jgi:hypothetical protein